MYVLGVGDRRRHGAASQVAESCGIFRNSPAMIAGMRAADKISADPGCASRIPLLSAAGHGMTPLSQLTFRNFLIAAHDALATAFALLASFYLRFEGARRSFDRLPLLLRILPLLRRLQRGDLLRLQSDDHEMAFHFAAGCAEHPARGDRADGRAPGAGLCLHCSAPRTCKAPFFLGQITIVLYWFLEVFFLSALALRLSLFPLYARPPSRPDRRCVVDPVDRPRRRRRSAVARHRERRRQAALAGRRVVAVGRRPRPDDPQYAGARRHRRCRGRDCAISHGATSRSRAWS